jgi:hypothetical protein
VKPTGQLVAGETIDSDLVHGNTASHERSAGQQLVVAVFRREGGRLTFS